MGCASTPWMGDGGLTKCRTTLQGRNMRSLTFQKKIHSEHIVGADCPIQKEVDEHDRKQDVLWQAVGGTSLADDYTSTPETRINKKGILLLRDGRSMSE